MGKLDSFGDNVIPLKKDTLPQPPVVDEKAIVDPFLKPSFIDPSLLNGKVVPFRSDNPFQPQGCFEISIPNGQTLGDILQEMAQSVRDVGALEN